MRKRRRADFEVFGNPERLGHFADVETRIAALGRPASERVGEHCADSLDSVVVGINVDSIVGGDIAKSAQVVHTRDVVGVPVREDKNVRARDRIFQALQAELGSRVDLHFRSVRVQVDTRTRAPVFGVGEVDSAVVVADYGDSLRSSRTHENQLHRTRTHTAKIPQTRA